MSEWQAYRRVDVARLSQKFPIVLDLLADGRVHFTAVHRLGPSLTEETHRQVLQEAVHKSREQIEEIVARLRPKPPMPSMVRKLPVLNVEQNAEKGGLFETVSSDADAPDSGSSQQETRLADRTGFPSVAEATSAETPRIRKAVVSPLAPELYKIQFTADAETHQVLRQLQELMRHQIPNGDPAEIVKRGLVMLLDHVKQQKFAQVKRPRKQRHEKVVAGGQPDAPAERGLSTERAASVKGEVPVEKARKTSRHIPAEVKRAVWDRDAGRCAFVSKSGRRCSELGRLEYHHVYPFGLGGEATVGNISLRCRTHNAYEGEVIFGEAMRRNGKVNTGGTLTGAGTS